MSTEIILLDPGDSAIIEIDWASQLPSGVTLTSVEHTVPAPLTRVNQETLITTSKVKATGVAHGGLYLIEAAATLSNDEVINRQFPARGWNS